MYRTSDMFGNLADARSRRVNSSSAFLCVLDGAAQKCKHVSEVLERRETIGSSSQIFWKTQKKSVMQKNKGVVSGIYTRPPNSEEPLISRQGMLLGINEINPALI